jgi:hypothetical protein
VHMRACFDSKLCLVPLRCALRPSLPLRAGGVNSTHAARRGALRTEGVRRAALERHSASTRRGVFSRCCGWVVLQGVFGLAQRIQNAVDPDHPVFELVVLQVGFRPPAPVRTQVPSRVLSRSRPAPPSGGALPNCATNRSRATGPFPFPLRPWLAGGWCEATSWWCWVVLGGAGWCWVVLGRYRCGTVYG